MATEHVETVTSPIAEREYTTTTNTNDSANTTQSHRWNWQDALYLSILVFLVVAMGYRYVPNLTGAVLGMWWDPLLNMWTLSWDTNTLLHNPTHLWQAQLLYPNPLTLSYSENLLGEVIFFAPIFLVSHNPVLAYNITFYLTFILCGTNMYFAARYYIGKPFAAFIAALIYAFAPYRLAEIDHIHILAGEWIPLAFLYLDSSLQQGRWRHWGLFTLFYLLQLLSSIYYGIFLSYTLLAYILIRYARPFIAQLRQNKLTYLKQLMYQAIKPLVAFLVAGIVLVILMKPYLSSLSHGLVRSPIESASYSAFIRDFLFTNPFNKLHGISTYNGVTLPLDGEHFLFLGWTIMALSLLGIILAFRRHNIPLRAFAWTGLIVLLFAFGPFLQYSTNTGAPRLPIDPYMHPFPPAIPMPWFLAYYILPGFKGLRVPARLIGVLLMMLAILSAYAVAWLQEMLHARRLAHIAQTPQKDEKIHTRRSSRPFSFRILALQCIMIVIPLALVAEALPHYLPVTPVPTGNAIPAVYQWLATHGDKEPIVELPMAHKDEDFTRKDEAWYDYYAIYHNHPLMNGWSGYRPDLTISIAGLLLDFPSQVSLDMLEKYHIKYVVFHPQIYLKYHSPDVVATMLAQMQASPRLHMLQVFGSDLASSDSVWQVL